MIKQKLAALTILAALTACTDTTTTSSDSETESTTEGALGGAATTADHPFGRGLCAPPVDDGVLPAAGEDGAPPMDGEGPPPPPDGAPPPDGEGPPPPPMDGGAPHHRPDPLAFVYDRDESRSLDDAERQQRDDDMASGCEARNARLLADFDDDGSGSLSEDEWLSARAALEQDRAAHRALVDADSDGEVTEEERRAAGDAVRAEVLATYDSDDSGDLDLAERTVWRDDLRALVQDGEPLPCLPPPPPAE